MDKRQVYTLVGVAILCVSMAAIIAGYFIIKNNEAAPQSKEMKSMDHSAMPMGVNMESTLYKKYAALKGEDYDKAFITNMIVHHENAISMAKLAATNANRQEVKDIASSTVTIQTKELGDMTNWQKLWSYPAGADHNSKDVEHEGSKNEEMLTSETRLKKLTGNDFDKVFLELMITNQEDVINMASPAQENAFHQELKKLAQDIVTNQTKAMAQLHTWQSQWNLK